MKEAAKLHHDDHWLQYPNVLVIYTDSSGIEGKIGTAAVAPQEKQVKKVFLKDQYTSTVYTT